MATKFERIFRMAKLIMRSEGLKAKEAILRAIAWDDGVQKQISKPTAEQIGEIRNRMRRIKE